MTYLANAWDVFASYAGFSFCTYLLLILLWIKNFILQVKQYGGETWDYERNDDMGTQATYMGTAALLLLFPFYRPIFFFLYGRKVKKLGAKGKLWLSDLLGGYLPILALVLLCGLGAIDVIEWTYVGLPLFLSEAIAFFLLRQRMKTAPEPHFEK